MITIVLTTYNGENYISAQLESIFNQSYLDFKLVLIDDNSTDNTVRLIFDVFKKYSFQDYVFRKSGVNMGPTKAFELGVSLVTTKYVVFCDQDDIWFENKLEYYLQAVQSEDYDLVYAPSYLMHNDKATSTLFPEKRIYKTVLGRLAHNDSRGATIMLKTRLALSLMPYYELYDKWIFVISRFVAKIKCIEEPLHFYRIHSNNVNGGGFRNRSTNSLLSVQKNNKLFYEKMHFFFRQTGLLTNESKEDILHGIEHLIKIADLTINSLQNRNRVKSLLSYARYVLFSEFTLMEKLIYFYYFLLKKS